VKSHCAISNSLVLMHMDTFDAAGFIGPMSEAVLLYHVTTDTS
jgi:hypothetical protein